MSGHECEKWQLRESPDGGWFCAACGESNYDQLASGMVEATTEYMWLELPSHIRDAVRSAAKEFTRWAHSQQFLIAGELANDVEAAGNGYWFTESGEYPPRQVIPEEAIRVVEERLRFCTGSPGADWTAEAILILEAAAPHMVEA